MDPDWYPIDPQFGTDVMTTQEKCTAGHCTYQGIDRTVSDPPMPATAAPFLPPWCRRRHGLMAVAYM